MEQNQYDDMIVVNIRRRSLWGRIKYAPGHWLDLYQFIRVQDDSRLLAIAIATRMTAQLFKRYGDS